MDFRAIKERVSMRDVAQMYGITIARGDMAVCPFHREKTPSMKIYKDGFYCFGCGAGGDVINFTARLYSLSNIDAAKKLDADFGLGIGDEQYNPAQQIKRDLERERIAENEMRFLEAYTILCAKAKCLRRNMHDRSGRNAAKLACIEYYIDLMMPIRSEDINAKLLSEVEEIVRSIHHIA